MRSRSYSATRAAPPGTPGEGVEVDRIEPGCTRSAGTTAYDHRRDGADDGRIKMQVRRHTSLPQQVQRLVAVSGNPGLSRWQHTAWRRRCRRALRRRSAPPRRGASTITRTNCSVPDGRSRTRPVSPRRASATSTASRTAGSGTARPPVGHLRTLSRTCGSRFTTEARSARTIRSRHPGHHAAARSAGRRRWWRAPAAPTWPDCSPPRPNLPARTPRGRTGRRPGGTHRRYRIPHRQVQSEVAHHRRDQGVVGELTGLLHGQSEHGHDLVAVDRRARGVDGQAAVGIAVVSDTEIGSVFPDGLPQRFRGAWTRHRR